MPWAAAMTSTLKISSRAYTQAATGEWEPPSSITWSSITGVDCRIFPANESEIQKIWGQALKFDVVAWVDVNDVSGLSVETLTSGSGGQVPVQVTDPDGNSIEYMAVSARPLANQGKILAIALRRWTHG